MRLLEDRGVDVSCSTKTLAVIFPRALLCDLVLAHWRTVFLSWTCGYRRGASAVAIALKDDPQSSQGIAEVAGGDNRLHRHARRWTIDYDHFIDVLYIGLGFSNSSSAALRV